MNWAVFLDRDQTLIHRSAPYDADPIKVVRGAASAIASLRGLGYKVVVVTNQDCVARGECSEDNVAAIHERINELLSQSTGAEIDRFYFCPYHPGGTVEQYRRDHPWQKPSPGMLLQAAKDLNIDLAKSWMIGDQMIDIEAGAAAGVRTILLNHAVESVGFSPGAFDAKSVKPDYIAPTLVDAVKVVAQQRHPEASRSVRTIAASRTPEPSPLKLATSSAPAVAHSTSISLQTAPQSAPVGQFTPTVSMSADEPAELPDHRLNANADKASLPEDPVVQKLSQILQELRNQRVVTKPFSFMVAIALLLQMIAVVCLMGALVMGVSDDSLFLRWIAAGLVVQLATMALLLFDRRS